MEENNKILRLIEKLGDKIDETGAAHLSVNDNDLDTIIECCDLKLLNELLKYQISIENYEGAEIIKKAIKILSKNKIK